MDDWVLPASLAQPVPRKVRPAWRWFAAVLVILVGLFAPLVVVVVEVLAPEHQTQLLVTRGVDITGTVVKLEPRYRVRRGYRGPFVDFRYEPNELTGKPDWAGHGRSWILEQDYRSLKVGAAIPLVYDPLHPEHAELKAHVEAHRLRTGRPYWVPGLVLAILLPVAVGPITLPFMLAPYFRERRLLKWGKATHATLAGQFEFPTGDGQTYALTYTFEDENGVRSGGQTTVYRGPKDGPLPASMISTVVYDPHDSGRNMLYPGKTAGL